MLELKNIKKNYIVGDVKQEVLKGIDINFRECEFTSILGASGSGKTTLLNIIGGLDNYNNGDLIIDGTSTKKYKDSDWDIYRNHRVGFIFQSYNLISHQTILQNVELALTLSGVSKTERRKRAKQALKDVGLEHHISKRPNQLSGGQMQRVAIARALVNNPEIILADEPTGALDSDTSIQIMDLLKEVAKNKLVIMVTHNPELAKQYSTRIIELKDGIIVNDSNPYNEVGNSKERKMNKISMSLLTSLSLSFNNLMTKKGRTFLTAFAGSIGIIGIALILSLSNGVTNYVSNVERNALSDYPISLEKNTYDFSTLFNISEETSENDCRDGVICSTDDITSSINLLNNGLIKENNLSALKQYLENDNEVNNYISEIKYGYDLDLQIYSTNHSNYIRINPNNFTPYGTTEYSEEDANVSLNLNTDATPVFTELLDNEKVLESKYEILAGSLPKEYNELVLIVGKDNKISDTVLYSLDIKDRKELTDILLKIQNGEDVKIDSTEYTYEDIMNISYKLVLNTDYYKLENGIYKDYSNDKDYLKEIVNNGLDIKIVGVVRAKDDSVENSVIGYKHSLTEYVINSISKTDIYKEQINNKEINVLTKEKFDNLTSTYESNCNLLGIADLDNPSSINIYPKDFDSKEKLIEMLDTYNENNKKNGNEDLVVTYTDLIKTMVSGITSIINIISYVLIGFVAISLIVSSIMISIITYISVLERTKEIGILRAIGASKKDIKRVFQAETIIEGFVAGLLGIIITWLLCFPINAIVNSIASISNIASLPIGSGIFLIILSTLITLFAGNRPAKMASKKDPVEALRSE